MKIFKKKGFTLIELIVVLVIMAIIALIVTPLVMSIIKKAKISADKRSIDAYGRSIELAIAGYLLDTGSFPTDINQLTIEYSGEEVVCTNIQLNSDSSVYLSGCTVGGRSVDYTYGSDKSPSYQTYSIGDEVTYNNVDYYVIKDSGAKESTVTLLKAEPLTAEEITTYSTGTGAGVSGNAMHYGVTNDYSTSYVKTTVEAWRNAQAPATSEARLISLNELKNSLGYEWGVYDVSNEGWIPSESTPVFISSYDYWTMTPYNDSSSNVWKINNGGSISVADVTIPYGLSRVRPVIVLDKSVLSS